jgi:hypothetical protein
LLQVRGQRSTPLYYRPIPRKTAERGTVTTKEIPKRELRVRDEEPVSIDPVITVTTKEIPKRELRALQNTRTIPIHRIQHSRVTTKEIPKRELRVVRIEKAEAVESDEFSYNKRNPKKGIESHLYGAIGSEFNKWRMLQQKKSQKGN